MLPLNCVTSKWLISPTLPRPIILTISHSTGTGGRGVLLTDEKCACFPGRLPGQIPGFYLFRIVRDRRCAGLSCLQRRASDHQPGALQTRPERAAPVRAPAAVDR